MGTRLKVAHQPCLQVGIQKETASCHLQVRFVHTRQYMPALMVLLPPGKVNEKQRPMSLMSRWVEVGSGPTPTGALHHLCASALLQLVASCCAAASISQQRSTRGTAVICDCKCFDRSIVVVYVIPLFLKSISLK